jgi:hypothetical protein
MRIFTICTPCQNIISTNRSRRVRWGEEGHLALKGGKEMQTVSVGKHEGKRPLRRHTRRWENNIKFISPRTGNRGRFFYSQYKTHKNSLLRLQKKCEEFLEWLRNY